MKVFARSSLIKLLVTATGYALIAGGLAQPAAAHTGEHFIKVGGQMHIEEDDWPSDTVKDLPLSSENMSWPVGATRTGGGCFDEVRGWWQMTLKESAQFPGWLQAHLDMRLYEGASCKTEDLDGVGSASFWIPPNSTVKKTFTVQSTEAMSDDSIAFTFVINHNITG